IPDERMAKSPDCTLGLDFKTFSSYPFVSQSKPRGCFPSSTRQDRLVEPHQWVPGRLGVGGTLVLERWCSSGSPAPKATRTQAPAPFLSPSHQFPTHRRKPGATQVRNPSRRTQETRYEAQEGTGGRFSRCIADVSCQRGRCGRSFDPVREPL